MDYNIQKTDKGLEVWTTSKLSLYIKRVLEDSFLVDFISVDSKMDGILPNYSYIYIDIINPIITKDCLIVYLDKIISDCIYLEKCFKLEYISNSTEGNI